MAPRIDTEHERLPLTLLERVTVLEATVERLNNVMMGTIGRRQFDVLALERPQNPDGTAPTTVITP